MKIFKRKTKPVAFFAFIIGLLFLPSAQSSLAFEKSAYQIISDYKSTYFKTLSTDWSNENEKLKECLSNLSKSTFCTDRLIIDETCEADIPALATILMDSEITEYLNATKTGPFENIEQSIQYVRKSLESNTIRFTVKLKDNLAVIGNIGYTITPSKKQISLGYYFGKEYQGKGYASESVQALTKKILDSIDFGNLCIYYHSKNYRSEKLAKKVIKYITANSHMFSCHISFPTQKGIITEYSFSNDSVLGFSTEILYINSEIKCLLFLKINEGVANESCR